MDRKLVTILCADMAGYSRLIGADEEGTLTRLKAHRHTVIDPKVGEHGGRIVKTMGDGLLIEFASPVEAVRCGVEIQQSMEWCSGALPADRRIAFRIGINLGDVIIEAGDVLGDAVNIAARLQSLSETGGICVSRAVRDQVRDRLPVTFDDLGEQRVKNIARPIRCYRVRFNEYAAPISLSPAVPRRWSRPLAAIASLIAVAGLGFLWAMDSGPALQVGGPAGSAAPSSLPLPKEAAEYPAPRMSIAVMPFANMSGDPEQEYFADGLAEDLTTDLSRIVGSFVIARNSAFTYKNKAVDARQVGRELGVRYVLEGSVRRSEIWFG